MDYVTVRALTLAFLMMSISDQSENVEKELAAVTVPLEEAVVSLAYSQCNNVKRILGVDYDQVNGSSGPDLSQLTLDYIIPGKLKVEYNLSTAAELLPKSKEFDAKKRLFIFFHGFRDDPSQSSYMNISTAFLSMGDCNIFALDASSLIGGFYLRASTYTKIIGTTFARLLQAVTKYGTDPDQIHLIGHSLGAHIASNAGKKYFKLTGHKVGRISGLDPAGPCFSKLSYKLRLISSDANFVDVIHTDAGVYGMKESVGHVDFFPNGGSQQPNCVSPSCSHGRVWLLYSESITNTTNFPAVKCPSYNDFRKGRCEKDIAYMGFGCSNSTRGLYYLQTNGDSPYGKGLNGTSFNNNEGMIRSIEASFQP